MGSTDKWVAVVYANWHFFFFFASVIEETESKQTFVPLVGNVTGTEYRMNLFVS